MPDAISKTALIDQINALTVDGEFSQADVNYLMNYIIANGDMTGTPRDMIQIRRGNAADLPTLAQGEMAFTLDTEKVYVGGANGNVGMVTADEVNKIVFGESVSPEMFGALGGGVVDDTLAVQAAINTGSPVIFKNSYGVTSIEVNADDSKYIDFNGFYLSALGDDFVFKVNTMYAHFYNVLINGNLRPNLAGCIKIFSGVSGVGNQAQFLTFTNTHLLNSPLGIQYGDGTINAQSENTFNRLTFRSIVRGINLNQPNGFLQITNSELDITPYEWSTLPPGGQWIVNQTVGGLFISNSTIECPSGGRGLIGGDFNIINCIIEIPNENFEFIGAANVNANCNISNCNFYKSQNNPLFTASIGINVNLDNVYCHGVSSPVHFSGTDALINFTFNNCRFDNFLQGPRARVLSCINSVFGDSTQTSNPLVPIEYTSNTETKKASKEVVVSFKARSNVSSSNVSLAFFNGETSTIVPTVAEANSVDSYYCIHMRPADEFDRIQLGIDNGVLSDIVLYTVQDGAPWTSNVEPVAFVYPTGAFIANTGASSTAKGWIYNGTTFVELT